MGNVCLKANGGDLTGERLPQGEGSPGLLASPGAHSAPGLRGWGWRSRGGRSGEVSTAQEKDQPCPQAQAPPRWDGQGLSPEQPAWPRRGSPTPRTQPGLPVANRA